MTISLPDGPNASLRSPHLPLLGDQSPRIGSWPSFTSTAGQEAIELAASAGVYLDPWQQLALHVSLSETPAGSWQVFQTVLVVCRQNGKGEIALARQLFGLFILGQRRQVHTAHEFKTAQDAFERITEVIESTPDLDRKVAKISTSHGDEGITLKSGAELRFFARTGGSGRGFAGDIVYLDEAFQVPEAVTRALVPILLSRGDAQLWWMSSAVDQAVHQHGQALAKLRRRAQAGGDPRLAYLEWSADEERYRLSNGRIDYEAAAADREALVEANPSLNQPREHAPTLQSFLDSRSSMSAQGFAVEHLGIGDWPKDEDDRPRVIDADVWAAAGLEPGVEGAVMRNPVVLAVDSQPGLRGRTSIGAGGWAPGGRPLVEVVENRLGSSWLVGRILQLVERHDPAAVLIDPSSPAGQFIEPLATAGVETTLVTARDQAAAFGLFFGEATSGRLAHLNDPILATALKSATTRTLSDALAWSRRDSDADISPLVAVTLARFGLEAYGRVVAAPAAPQQIPTAPLASAGSGLGGGVMTVGF